MIDSYKLTPSRHSDTNCYQSDQPTYVNEIQLAFYNNEIINICRHSGHTNDDIGVDTTDGFVTAQSQILCTHDDATKRNVAASKIQRAYRSFRRRRRLSERVFEEQEDANNYIEFLGECGDGRRSGYSLITTSNSASESRTSDIDTSPHEPDEIDDEEREEDRDDRYHNEHVYDSIPHDLSSPSSPDSPQRRPPTGCRHHCECPLSRPPVVRKHSEDLLERPPPHLGRLSHRLSEQPPRGPHSVLICEQEIGPGLLVVRSHQQQPLLVAVGNDGAGASHRVSRGVTPVALGHNYPIVVSVKSNSCQGYHHDLGNHRLSNDIIRQSLQQKQARIVNSQKIATAKRMYRIGLNVFNKNPVAGINYLIKYQHIKAHPSHIAKFLLTKSGISRNAIGDYIGSISDPLALQVTKYFLRRINMKDKQVDDALRSFIYYVHLPGESQKICHLMEEFKEAYIQQSNLKGQFKSHDTIMILAYAIIMLQTDAHNQSIRKSEKMTLEQFVNNLRGVDEGCDIERGILENIYTRVTSKEIKTQPDHTDQVRRLNDVISGGIKPSDLVNRIRRFMCYCRLSEIVDESKKNKSDVHQREVFLFNDILLITKSHNKSRKEDVQYQCKYALDLVDLRVKLFSTTNYLFGIELFDRKTNESKLKLNAQCEQDQKKFMFDLSDCIFESLEMLKVNYSNYLSTPSSQQPNSPNNSPNNLASKTPHTFSQGIDNSIPNPPRRQESLVRNDRPDVLQSVCRARNDSSTEKEEDRLKAYTWKTNSNNFCL